MRQLNKKPSKTQKTRRLLAQLVAVLCLVAAAGAQAKPVSQQQPQQQQLQQQQQQQQNQNQVRFRRLPPREFSAALGSSITIECEAGASPPPSIHWLKNGVRISQADLDENQLEDLQAGEAEAQPERIGLSSTRSRLFIDCADYAAEAEYSCVAENAYSRQVARTELTLIKPTPAPAPPASAENELLEADAQADNKERDLSALAQCPSQRAPEPARIHMWTHNIVEVMRNSVLLLCRSNAKVERRARVNGPEQQQQQQEQQQQQQQQPKLSWSLPDERPVTGEMVAKYELLETGDLLIKDLRWSDMGSYVCTVADEQGSDSVSAFVYPASVKAAGGGGAAPKHQPGARLARFR